MLRCIWIVCLASALAPSQLRPANGQDFVEQAVLRLDREWAQAEVKRDVATVRHIEAEDFVFTSPGGRMVSKSDDVNDLKTGAFKADAIELEDLKAHVHGDSAVVTGKATIRNGMYHGQDISGEYRFTDVFAKVNGTWQVVASQTTMLPRR